MTSYEMMPNTLVNTPSDPIVLFNQWFEEATQKELNDPNAMALAAVGADGRPSVRIVLLKGIQNGNFVFYTNIKSRKGKETLACPHVSLCFHWKSLRRQVRIEGDAAQVSDEQADAYFASRAKDSQIGAWASQQSHPLRDRSELEESIAQYALKFGDKPIPRPPHWSGFEITPHRIEFWEEQPFRLHNRIIYSKNTISEGQSWSQTRLYP